MPSLSWLPEFIVKKHKRARAVKMCASKEKGLVVTVPLRFEMRHLPEILETHKAWIIKQLHKFALQPVAPVPKEILLPFLEQKWKIHLMACNTALKLFTRPQQELVLIGRQEEQKSKKLLIAWLKQQALFFLKKELTSLSQHTQLSYTGLCIRDQRSRWGSCSERKKISLNYKLIFLPRNLTKHILLHELCHTKYLNHSDQFWELLANFDSDCHKHRRLLRTANQFVPDWVYP